jgi:hypothetical protein
MGRPKLCFRKNDEQHVPSATQAFKQRQSGALQTKANKIASNTNTTISGVSTAAQLPHRTQFPVLGSLK